jgi:hypothetical protein
VTRHPAAEALDGIVADACVQLFAGYGVTLEQRPPPPSPAQEVVICGVMGFTGPTMRGTILLATNRDPLGSASPVNDAAVRDWGAELTNQLLGRIKTKLLQHGVEIYLTLPVVLLGAHISPLPRGTCSVISFASPSGHVDVWFDADVADTFILAPVAVGTDDTLVEGDALLF